MQYLEVKRKDAEKAKAFLSKHGMLAKGFMVLHSARYVYFPLTISPATNKNLTHFSKSVGAKLRERSGSAETKRHTDDYKKEIEKILSLEEQGELARGYDPFGNIALIELSDSLKDREQEIGDAIISGSGTIKTVLAKSGPVKGIYRTRSVRYVAGVRTYIAKYRENGCSFEFDIRRVFFSPRLSYERARISKLVKDKECVAVPFAGVGPFAIEIAKFHQNSKVIAIELNPEAFRYMLRNIELNRVKNVTAFKGDFVKLAGMHARFADRVVMPMPKTSLDFIGAACIIAKKHAAFHIYTFCDSEQVESKIDEIKSRFEQNGRSFKLVNLRTVRPYSKNEIEIVVDAEATKIV
ncbi:MAG: class I SAM-dependent methyltransferase family protein [Candidatus Marsarchaeota archaeon]|nr:class I SAM-dependent methyltransferase family protein [Candidatus Marsarchaeota archaeon]